MMSMIISGGDDRMKTIVLAMVDDHAKFPREGLKAARTFGMSLSWLAGWLTDCLTD